MKTTRVTIIFFLFLFFSFELNCGSWLMEFFFGWGGESFGRNKEGQPGVVFVMELKSVNENCLLSI